MRRRIDPLAINQVTKPLNSDNDVNYAQEDRKARPHLHKPRHEQKRIVSRYISQTPVVKVSTLRFWFARNFIFVFGVLIGLVIARIHATDSLGFGISPDTLRDLSLSGVLDDFKGKLPMGIVQEASNFKKHYEELSKPFEIGLQLKNNEKLKPLYPVIMVPGVISTGLESWSLHDSLECHTKEYFRKRLWGSWNMLKAIILDKNCWLKSIMLDEETGLDPPYAKLRAAEGLDSADFFVTGYWIWGRILENLAAVGYDSGNMMVASYDWRLAFHNLEKRDRYFSKLKLSINNYMQETGKKTVLMSHSMGSQVVFYFLKWVEATGKGFGNGGPGWVNEHIEAIIDISGSTLGTPKALAALLSGEMKDTVDLNSVAEYGLEKFFSRHERARLLRSFGGIASMLPKGGNVVWGDLSGALDDTVNQNDTFGNFIRFKESKSKFSSQNLTVEEAIEYLMLQTDENFVRKTRDSYSYGLAKSRIQVEKNANNPIKWTNPLEVALPMAPDMKIYCFYGVGKPTERSYYYKEEPDKGFTHLNVTIDIENPNAVMLGQGDGTVSLLTHSMCHTWKRSGSKFNPGNIKVTIVEMAHEPDNFDIRGGAKTADHVDILGRTELNELVLRVATGQGENVTEHIFSPLRLWTEQMDFGND